MEIKHAKGQMEACRADITELNDIMEAIVVEDINDPDDFLAAHAATQWGDERVETLLALPNMKHLSAGGELDARVCPDLHPYDVKQRMWAMTTAYHAGLSTECELVLSTECNNHSQYLSCAINDLGKADP